MSIGDCFYEKTVIKTDSPNTILQSRLNREFSLSLYNIFSFFDI